MVVSDFRINSLVRSILAKRWLDLRPLKFGSFRGTVRVSGELYPRESRDPHSLKSSTIEILEREIRQIRGVNRVYFDLKNWRRLSSGAWDCTEGTTKFLGDDDGPRVYSLQEIPRESGQGKRTG